MRPALPFLAGLAALILAVPATAAPATPDDASAAAATVPASVPADAASSSPAAPHRPRGQLFVSPAGEPFRAAPGEPYPVVAWFAQADRDHDGRITRAELIADAEAFFAKLDTNHDGIIDGFENRAYEEDVLPEMAPRVGRLTAEDAGYGVDAPGVGRKAGTPRRERYGGGGGGGRRGGESYQGAGPYELLNIPQPVRAADADFSQKVTLEEFRAAASQRFDLLDTAHQGALTLAGLPKTPIQQLIETREARRK